MITFITALYSEAKGLISLLRLKKNPAETFYQLFEGEGFCLMVTGCGMLPAASAVARHFALHPATATDIAVNLGVAGIAFPDNPDIPVLPGSFYYVNKITEQTTGRTFYPDLLYKNKFSRMPVLTTPVVCTETSGLPLPTLIDMEASALYQALLPHISPERLFFFKAVSDIIGRDTASDIPNPEAFLAPHLSAMLDFIITVRDYFLTQQTEPAFSEEETALLQRLREKLPFTVTTELEFNRLLRYAKLAALPLAHLLTVFLEQLSETDIHGKKQAAPYLEVFRQMILTAPEAVQSTASSIPASLHVPFFQTVYAETDCIKLAEEAIEIRHYKDIFNRSHQNFAEQKKAPALILAKKSGTLLYPGACVCQSFGNEHFYYTSCMMNCIYHCDYCYLQGMYPSGHTVVFTNLEDYFAETESLLKQHPVYLCISYDTDLLALEARFGFVRRWLSFARMHPDLTLEIRTKSGNPAFFSALAALYENQPDLKKNIVFAWTVSPEAVITSAEHGAAPLALRLNALLAAKAAGFSVRLCFDPMIYHSGWKTTFHELVTAIFRIVSPDALSDVSIGVFRISTEYLKNMRKKRPDCALVQFPYITEKGVSHYGTLSEEMVHWLKNELLHYLPEEKIFLWNGGCEE